MEKLKEMKDILVESVEEQLKDLRHVDTHELGEVIDMIKDLEESMYYCSITKAMEGKDEEEKQARYSVHYSPSHTDTSMWDSSYASRKAYMESKEKHKDTAT